MNDSFINMRGSPWPTNTHTQAHGTSNRLETAMFMYPFYEGTLQFSQSMTMVIAMIVNHDDDDGNDDDGWSDVSSGFSNRYQLNIVIQ